MTWSEADVGVPVRLWLLRVGNYKWKGDLFGGKGGRAALLVMSLLVDNPQELDVDNEDSVGSFFSFFRVRSFSLLELFMIAILNVEEFKPNY